MTTHTDKVTSLLWFVYTLLSSLFLYSISGHLYDIRERKRGHRRDIKKGRDCHKETMHKTVLSRVDSESLSKLSAPVTVAPIDVH